MKRLAIAALISCVISNTYAQQLPPFTPSPNVLEYVQKKQAANVAHDAVLLETSGQIGAIITALNETTAKFDTFLANYAADITLLKTTAVATAEQLKLIDVEITNIKEAIAALGKMAGLTEDQLRTMLVAIIQR